MNRPGNRGGYLVKVRLLLWKTGRAAYSDNSADAAYRNLSLCRLYVRIPEIQAIFLSGGRYRLGPPFLGLLRRSFRLLIGSREPLDVGKESIRVGKIHHRVRRGIMREA